MNTKSKRLFRGILGAFMAVAVVSLLRTTVMAASGTKYLKTPGAGVSTALEIDLSDMDEAQIEKLAAKKTAEPEEEPAEELQQSGLVMANVKNTLNVRAEADEEADKTGYLYADCGGEILERKDGWTKLESGELIGWAKDEYLLFGEEAEKNAEEVGNLIVTIKTDALRVRKEPKEDAGIYGLLAKDDEMDVIENLGDWISISYDSKTGYISSEYVDAEFHIDEGETVEAVKEREKKEAEEKAKRTANRGAVAVDVPDEALLAALIQCEAGNQPYEGMVAVGAVVMNRVKSGAYPNTVRGVIYASGQFTPAMSGGVDRLLAKGGAKASCIQAAQEAIGGATTVGGAMHFRRAGNREGLIIGNHVFW